MGNNTPTFFIRDVHNFSDLNRAVKRDPRTGRRSAQNNWDFWTLLPECFHQITVVMSDRGIPASFSNMYFLVNILFPSTIRKTSVYGASSILRHNRESKICPMKRRERSTPWIGNTTGKSCTIQLSGEITKWTMYVQIMTEEQARNHYENPFDITKSGVTGSSR